MKKATINEQLDYLEKCIQTAIEITAKNERMLKWLVVRKNLDYLSHDLKHNEYRDEYREPILDEMFKLGEQLPDISDVIKKSGK